MSDLNSRTLTIEKTFDAPVQIVWQAWTQPEHIIKWWAPQGMEINVIEHNFETGGRWKYSMPMPDGSDFVSEGIYKEIVEFKKVITSADFKPMTENVEIQALFEDAGGKTKFTFNVVHATPEYCKQQEEMGFYNGWGSTLERLENTINSSIGL